MSSKLLSFDTSHTDRAHQKTALKRGDNSNQIYSSWKTRLSRIIYESKPSPLGFKIELYLSIFVNVSYYEIQFVLALLKFLPRLCHNFVSTGASLKIALLFLYRDDQWHVKYHVLWHSLLLIEFQDFEFFVQHLVFSAGNDKFRFLSL